tara:strand:- start:405 stop:698 length:294 start_codon:yes stop_codon:yes gene_type:complete
MFLYTPGLVICKKSLSQPISLLLNLVAMLNMLKRTTWIMTTAPFSGFALFHEDDSKISPSPIAETSQTKAAEMADTKPISAMVATFARLGTALPVAH